MRGPIYITAVNADSVLNYRYLKKNYPDGFTICDVLIEDKEGRFLEYFRLTEEEYNEHVSPADEEYIDETTYYDFIERSFKK